jgi:uncharacterized protein YbjT (DUF2867 family)
MRLLILGGTVFLGRHAVDAALARGHSDTVRDTLAWARTRPAGHDWRAGLPPQREAEVLREWREGQARPAPGAVA